jgi:AcrR family transcriptional regulator
MSSAILEAHSAPVRRTKASQAEETRARLIEAAHQLFAEQGYAATGTEQILSRTGLTRGALYHHFKDKADLFAAVYERIELEAVEVLSARLVDATDPLEALERGCLTWLEFVARPDVLRILVREAPAVMAFKTCMDVDFQHAGRLLVDGVGKVVRARLVAVDDAEVLTMVFHGSLNALSSWISDDPTPERIARAGTVVRQMIAAMRLAAPGAPAVG